MSMLPELEIGATVGIVGLAVVQSLSMYREACPSITDIRDAPPADVHMRQRLLDADIYGSIAVLVIGGTASVLARSWVPVVIGSLGLVLISYYHRSVLNSPSPMGYVDIPATREGSNFGDYTTGAGTP